MVFEISTMLGIWVIHYARYLRNPLFMGFEKSNMHGIWDIQYVWHLRYPISMVFKISNMHGIWDIYVLYTEIQLSLRNYKIVFTVWILFNFLID